MLKAISEARLAHEAYIKSESDWDALAKANRNDLAGALQNYFNRNQPQANLPPLQRPAELNDPNTAPALRAQVLESYVAALTDRPSNSWSAQDKADIREQLVLVTRNM